MKNTKETPNKPPGNKNPKPQNIANIGKKVTFPDSTTFPIHSIFDVFEGYTQVCYFDSELPQILWVPNDFITND
jgi:hypothetical protein